MGSDCKVVLFIEWGGVIDNSAKQLEAKILCNAFIFSHLVRPAGGQPGMFLALSARPLDHHAIDFVMLPQAKRYGQFGLRKITGTAAHDTRLHLTIHEYFYAGANRIAI